MVVVFKQTCLTRQHNVRRAPFILAIGKCQQECASAFHSGMWQRVYTVESQKSLNRNLWGATALAIPITFLLGMAGIAAVGNGSVESIAYPEVSAALFALASDLSPSGCTS